MVSTTTRDAFSRPEATAGTRRRLLRIWLQDRLAASAFGLELMGRFLNENRDEPIARELRRVHDELKDERRALEKLARSCGVSPPRLKQTAVWALEKLGRLKPNGMLFGYSPLSRLEELEAMLAATYAREIGWKSLLRLENGDLPEDHGVDIVEVANTAERHRELFEELVYQAAHRAL